MNTSFFKSTFWKCTNFLCKVFNTCSKQPFSFFYVTYVIYKFRIENIFKKFIIVFFYIFLFSKFFCTKFRCVYIFSIKISVIIFYLLLCFITSTSSSTFYHISYLITTFYYLFIHFWSSFSKVVKCCTCVMRAHRVYLVYKTVYIVSIFVYNFFIFCIRVLYVINICVHTSVFTKHRVLSICLTFYNIIYLINTIH